MGIDVGRANMQANEIEGHARTLRDTKISLAGDKSQLNGAWQAHEMVHVNEAILRLENDLSAAANVLNGLQSDVVSVAHEIRQEELAREAAARAAAEAAARAAAAREAAARDAALRGAGAGWGRNW